MFMNLIFTHDLGVSMSIPTLIQPAYGQYPTSVWAVSNQRMGSIQPAYGQYPTSVWTVFCTNEHEDIGSVVNPPKFNPIFIDAYMYSLHV